LNSLDIPTWCFNARARMRACLLSLPITQVLLAVHVHTKLQVAVKVMNHGRVRKQSMEGKVRVLFRIIEMPSLRFFSFLRTWLLVHIFTYFREVGNLSKFSRLILLLLRSHQNCSFVIYPHGAL